MVPYFFHINSFGAFSGRLVDDVVFTMWLSSLCSDIASLVIFLGKATFSFDIYRVFFLHSGLSAIFLRMVDATDGGGALPFSEMLFAKGGGGDGDGGGGSGDAPPQ